MSWHFQGLSDKELGPAEDLCAYMLGGTLLFVSQQHRQEVPMLTEESPSACRSYGLNSPAHRVLKNKSALRAEIQSQGVKTD